MLPDPSSYQCEPGTKALNVSLCVTLANREFYAPGRPRAFSFERQVRKTLTDQPEIGIFFKVFSRFL